MEDGIYQIVLNSDAGEFGGFSRIKDDMPYETFSTGAVNMYLPSRTALVLKKE
jgi:1,4-alpha-glucan branching enzyme